MKNSEDPAYPNNYGGNRSGLTKREYFAAKAMQGILSSVISHLPSADGRKNICQDAIKFADELLNQLDS